jgi:hypothetical protein
MSLNPSLIIRGAGKPGTRVKAGPWTRDIVTRPDSPSTVASFG